MNQFLAVWLWALAWGALWFTADTAAAAAGDRGNRLAAVGAVFAAVTVVVLAWAGADLW